MNSLFHSLSYNQMRYVFKCNFYSLDPDIYVVTSGRVALITYTMWCSTPCLSWLFWFSRSAVHKRYLLKLFYLADFPPCLMNVVSPGKILIVTCPFCLVILCQGLWNALFFPPHVQRKHSAVVSTFMGKMTDHRAYSPSGYGKSSVHFKCNC